ITLEKKEFLSLYENDPFVKTIANAIKSYQGKTVHLKGLSGSIDMILVTVVSKINKGFHLIVAHDKEEAAFLAGDLQEFHETDESFLFPSSYKVPYQLDEVENANVLMRAEILNRILNKDSSTHVLVTYPAALFEKVVNKQSLKENTFTAQIGEKVDVEFIAEILSTYDFEKTDFVYEPGQFAIRGGIIDVFSYSNEIPFRLELIGREIESIRAFDPESQLSIAPVKKISIVPNIQTQMIRELRQSFLEFLPEDTTVWFKDYQMTLDEIDESFIKASEKFNLLNQRGGESNKLLIKPSDLYENAVNFEKVVRGLNKIEFGNKFYLPTKTTFQLEIKPQPSF